MSEIYFYTRHKINGAYVPFRSTMPYIFRGCYRCKKFKNEDFETQARNLKYHNGFLLCKDCLADEKPCGKIKSVKLVTIRDSKGRGELKAIISV